MSARLLLGRVAAASSRNSLNSNSQISPRLAISQVRLASTGGSSVGEAGTRPAAKGPSGPEVSYKDLMIASLSITIF